MGESSLADIIVEISCQTGAFDHSITGKRDASMEQIADFQYELHAPPPLLRVCDPNLFCNSQFALKTRGGGTSL